MVKSPEISTHKLDGVKNVKIYKILAGEGTDTLKSYNDTCIKISMADQDRKNTRENLDWRAMYTQFQREHVLGTVPYRWERGGKLLYEEATLVEVTFDELDVVVLDGPLFIDGSVDGATKALAAKAMLDIPTESSLMAALGKVGKVAMVRETEDEWELVIPHELLEQEALRYSERPLVRFQRLRAMPLTGKYCCLRPTDDRKWKGWNEGVSEHELCDVVPDLSTDWSASAH